MVLQVLAAAYGQLDPKPSDSCRILQAVAFLATVFPLLVEFAYVWQSKHAGVEKDEMEPMRNASMADHQTHDGDREEMKTRLVKHG